MAYFYSEQGMKFFIVLLALLTGWFCMGISRAALSENTSLPADAGQVAQQLYPAQSVEIKGNTGVLLMKAFAVQEE